VSLPAVELVVFDAGGVLLRICRSWQEACARAGLPFHTGITDPACLAHRRQLVRAYETGGLTCDQFFPALASSVGRYTVEQVRAVHDAWIIEEYPGVADLARDLRDRGIATALLSNTNAAHWATFPAYPVMNCIGSLFASHLLRAAKPDASAFSAVSRALESDPTRMLLFDDLPDNIAGAAAAGWQTHLVDHTGDTAAQMRQALRARNVI
jgi:HAD superfamily hydrolase (TIGR01509 family)